MNTLSSITNTVLQSMKLVRIPKNIGTGRYSTWTDEAKAHNENVVRPFRQNVANGVKAEFDRLTGHMSIEDKDALVTLLVDVSSDDCLKFPELCFGTPARDTKTSKGETSHVLTFDQFYSALKVATPKMPENSAKSAYADYLLKA